MNLVKLLEVWSIDALFRWSPVTPKSFFGIFDGFEVHAWSRNWVCEWSQVFHFLNLFWFYVLFIAFILIFRVWVRRHWVLKLQFWLKLKFMSLVHVNSCTSNHCLLQSKFYLHNSAQRVIVPHYWSFSHIIEVWYLLILFDISFFIDFIDHFHIYASI